MPNISELEKVVSKELHVFYVLDTSGSMTGAPIAALNDAMRATVRELAGINKTNGDADFKIGVLEFNSAAHWVTVNASGDPIVQDMEDFFWSDLQANGLTALGDALTELNKQLSRSNLQQSATGNKAPVIIFMSDGGPNDNWTPALDALNKNAWYQQAIKIAFALGDDADTDVLSRVVGTSEAVIQTTDLETFKNMIRVVSVTSSLAASVSKPKDTPVTGAGVVKQVLGNAAEPAEPGAPVVPPEGFDPLDPYGPDDGSAGNIDFAGPDIFI